MGELRSHRIVYRIGQGRGNGDHGVFTDSTGTVGAVQLGRFYRNGLDLFREILSGGDLIVQRRG